MSVHSVLLQIFCFFTLAVALPQNAITTAKSGCQSRCGNLEIPYPFGIGSNCSRDTLFNINCNTSFEPPKPYLVNPYIFNNHDSDYEVVHISETQIYLKNTEAQLAKACYGTGDNKTENSTIPILMRFSGGSPYTLSDENQVTSLGCDDLAMVDLDVSKDSDGSFGCTSFCINVTDPLGKGSCPGRGCCQTFLSKGTSLYVNLSDMHGYWGRDGKLFRCSFAFFGMKGDHDKFNFSLSHLNDSTTFLNNNKEFMSTPFVVDWRITPNVTSFSFSFNCTEAQNPTNNYACQKNSYCIEFDHEYFEPYINGYHCKCKKGYEGNPYLGCQDINECMINNECVSSGTCTNTQGSYYCSCPYGYRGDGKRHGIGCIPISVSHRKLAIGVGLSTGMGSLVLLSSCIWLYKFQEKIKTKKCKDKFFKRNGGLLLQQQISTDEGILQKTRLFSVKELEKATDYLVEVEYLVKEVKG